MFTIERSSRVRRLRESREQRLRASGGEAGGVTSRTDIAPEISAQVVLITAFNVPAE